MPDDFRRAAVERKRCLVMDVQVVDQRRRQYGLAGPKQPDKTDSFVGAAGVEAWQGLRRGNTKRIPLVRAIYWLLAKRDWHQRTKMVMSTNPKK